MPAGLTLYPKKSTCLAAKTHFPISTYPYMNEILRTNSLVVVLYEVGSLDSSDQNLIFILFKHDFL